MSDPPTNQSGGHPGGGHAPYAAPGGLPFGGFGGPLVPTHGPGAGPPAHSGLRYEAGALVAPRGMDLGGSCIKCGNPDAPHRRQVNLWKLPPATYFALLLSLPAFVVIALLIRKKSDHWINLCAPCNAAWAKAGDETAWSTIALVGAPAVGIFTALAGMVMPTVLLFTAGPLMGLAGLWAAAKKRLTARQIDQHDVRIDGVSEHYAPRPLPALPPYDSGTH